MNGFEITDSVVQSATATADSHCKMMSRIRLRLQARNGQTSSTRDKLTHRRVC